MEKMPRHVSTRKVRTNAKTRTILRLSGLQPSTPRVVIYEWLMAHPVHPTVDTLYCTLRPTMPSLSRTTVYNVLHALVEHQLADKVCTEDLELRYDGNTLPHAHFKCTQCGTVMDLEKLPDELPGVQLPQGCKANKVAVTVWGLCPKCAK
ncbi:MAG: Fur family transcriptional regulator [Kiritimatiellia bacterium]